MKTSAILTMAALMTAAAGGCATQRPVLYPNDTLETRGRARAEQAIDQCVQRARTHGVDSSRGGELASGTVTEGAVGAGTGAAVGAVLGDAGTGAAAGAAGGAARGLLRGLFGGREPDPVFREFVDRCLRERGYEPIGWK